MLDLLLFDDLKIVITSRGRYKSFPRTLKYIHQDLLQYIDFYCYEPELELYKRTIEKETKNLQIRPYPKSLDNLTEIRKWLIETCEKPYLIFIDDDLDLYTRTIPTKTKQKTVSGYYIYSFKWFEKIEILQDQIGLFYWFKEMLSKPDIGTCSLRLRTTAYQQAIQLNCDCPEKCIEFNTRISQFFGLDLEKWKLTNSDFEGIILKQDFYIALQFLSNCYKTVSNYYWVFSDSTKANDKTGCNRYRTLELNNQQVRYFHKLYPNFTEIITKREKLWKNRFDNREVLELKVFWKKVYEDCKKKQKSIKTIF